MRSHLGLRLDTKLWMHVKVPWVQAEKRCWLARRYMEILEITQHLELDPAEHPGTQVRPRNYIPHE